MTNTPQIFLIIAVFCAIMGLISWAVEKRRDKKKDAARQARWREYEEQKRMWSDRTDPDDI